MKPNFKLPSYQDLGAIAAFIAAVAALIQAFR